MWKWLMFLSLTILVTGTTVSEESLESDKQVLLSLKEFLEKHNKVNHGRYSSWNVEPTQRAPCDWPGITCSDQTTTNTNKRVVGVSLSATLITGPIFPNFSALTALTHLDLSKNTLVGPLPLDLARSRSLTHLNLSHNTIQDSLTFSGFDQLQVLDLTMNRFHGAIRSRFPSICPCPALVVANLSENNFTGEIGNAFDACSSLKYLDLSSNKFTGPLWSGFSRLVEFSVSNNGLVGSLSTSVFARNCSLQVLDLSENHLVGQVPGEISNCRSLIILHLWRNNFTGQIPAEIGTIQSLEALFLGDNKFSRQIPESLLALERLAFLDLSKNGFGPEIQPIFGRFEQVKFLVLHGNSYTDGIISSQILKLPNVVRLDLSFNNFSGPLPVEISEMKSLEILSLAYNQFNATIPLEYGNFSSLQALDLSFNKLTGSIPPTLGKLNSLLWLMLANNSLTGRIPKELGNCSSLLWLNLANNKLSGEIPSQLSNVGNNPTPTFEKNKRKNERIVAGSGECLAMKRWIPADYPPFSFAYTILTRKSCRSIWDRVLKGNGLFPICVPGSSVRMLQVSGYVQLSGNELSGTVPSEIGSMKSLSMLHLGLNHLSGDLPSQIGNLPLVVLNVTQNNLSGQIPSEIGKLKCLQNLDLSSNNFSGDFPSSLSDLSELNKFNISYNPLITGFVPAVGQLTTFDKDSYLGNPLLLLPNFIKNSSDKSPPPPPQQNASGAHKRTTKLPALLVFLILTLAFLACGIVTLIVCSMLKVPPEAERYLLPSSASVSASLSSSDTVKVIRLDKTAFSHADILRATGNFSERRIIGKGGFATVYRGVLPDGRDVAVKKLQSQGKEGEREFRAEMEALTGDDLGWPHPNLVTLYGWCLDGTARILVYEYVDGGSLEDMIGDWDVLTWRRRVEVAVDVARALVFLHHECYPAIVHRDVKSSNVLLHKKGQARVTDFGLARFVECGDSHVSTMVAGTVGYVAPEYGQTWRATTKGDVYSFGVVAMELATGRRAVVGGEEECLVEWGRRVAGAGGAVPEEVGREEMCEVLRVGIKCTAESPQERPNMKEVLAMLVKIVSNSM